MFISYEKFPYIPGSIYWFSLLFYWSGCLYMCQDHAILIICIIFSFDNYWYRLIKCGSYIKQTGRTFKLIFIINFCWIFKVNFYIICRYEQYLYPIPLPFRKDFITCLSAHYCLLQLWLFAWNSPNGNLFSFILNFILLYIFYSHYFQLVLIYILVSVLCSKNFFILEIFLKMWSLNLPILNSFFLY